jgi:hypothetical protein
MSVVYVARSNTVAEWASDVGLGKNIFKVGVADDADQALAELNAGVCGGTDWAILTEADAGDLTTETAAERITRKEKMIDPKLYPRLRGTIGLFRVKQDNVENNLMLKKALDGMQIAALKIKPVDIANYLLKLATG